MKDGFIFTRDYVRGAGRSFDKAGYDLVAKTAKKTSTMNPLYVLLSNLVVLQTRLDLHVKGRQNSAVISEAAEEGILLAVGKYQEAIVKKVEAAQAVIDRATAAEVDLEGKKDHTADLLELTRATNRYGGMTDGELVKEVDRYVTATKPESDVQLLDALSKEVKHRGGLSRHEVLRQAMERNHAGQLWRSDVTAIAALQEIEFYQNITPGRVSFQVKGEDGKEGTMGFPIKDLVKIKKLSEIPEKVTG